MLKTTTRIRVCSEERGLLVKPDQLLLPVRIRVHGPKPEAAAKAFEALTAAVAEACAHQVRHEGYKSWTEKLAGKGAFGRGARHHIEDLCVCVVPLPEAWSFTQRVTALEALRGRLHALDESALQFGEAQWVVSKPKQHHPALLAALREELDRVTTALALDVVGATLHPIQVQIFGPDRAELSMEAEWHIGRVEALAQP